MDVLLLITTRDSAPVATGLAAALTRAGAAWGCFLTNDGVELLRDPAFTELLPNSLRAAVCEHSWERAGGGDCPIELGSQTINCEMMAGAARVVGL